MELLTKIQAIRVAIDATNNLIQNGNNCCVQFITSSGIIEYYPNHIFDEFGEKINNIFHSHTYENLPLSEKRTMSIGSNGLPEDTPYLTMIKLDKAVLIRSKDDHITLSPMLLHYKDIIGISIKDCK